MPVVIEFILLDEEPTGWGGENAHRIATAKGIYAELERQLQDPNSHLRRKSAFGALVSLGASTRVLGQERLEATQDFGLVPPAFAGTAGPKGRCATDEAPGSGARTPQTAGSPTAAAASEGPGSPPSASARAAAAGPFVPVPAAAEPRPAGPTLSGPLATPSPPERGPGPMPAAAARAAPGGVREARVRADLAASDLAASEFKVKGVASVPKILDFPKPPARQASIPLSGLGILRSLFACATACTPATCGSSSPLDSCTILVSDAEPAQGPCVPLPASAASMKEDPSSAFELGLGGWPLCIPNVYAAFPPPQPQMGAARQGSEGGGLLQVADTSASCGSGWAPSSSSSALGQFWRVALEVDDYELTVVLAPPPQQPQPVLQHQRSSSRGAASEFLTPSTAASATDQQLPALPEVFPPPWAHHGRVALCRDALASFQVWPVVGAGPCARPEKLLFSDTVPPWPHLVEVTGRPRGAPRSMSILLALPTAALASRLADALGRVRRRKSRMLDGGPGGRGALRCELHINAKVNLDVGVNSVNCAAVVRRGISEACHVGADRVRICSVRGSGCCTISELSPNVPVIDISGASGSSTSPSPSKRRLPEAGTPLPERQEGTPEPKATCPAPNAE